MSSVKNYSAVESELLTKADKQLNIHNLITDLAVRKFVSAQNYLEIIKLLSLICSTYIKLTFKRKDIALISAVIAMWSLNERILKTGIVFRWILLNVFSYDLRTKNRSDFAISGSSRKCFLRDPFETRP